MKILVTGANNGLGYNAIAYLLQQGVSVRAAGSNPALGNLLSKMGAEFIHTDFNNLVSAQAKTILNNVDSLWHCSGFTSPWGSKEMYETANVTATRRLGEWATAYNIKNFIHISSPAVYFDYHHHRNISEEFTPQRYSNAYAQSKADSEAVIQTLALANPHTHFTILRPQGLFGPHDNILLPRLLNMIKRQGTVLLPRHGNALWDMTYQENVAHAMWLATLNNHTPTGRVYNITNHQSRPIRAVLQQLIDALQVKCRIRSVPYSMLDMMARSMERFASSKKEPILTHYAVSKLNFDMTLNTLRAQNELGYTPLVSIDEGINRTADWLRNHGGF